MSSRLSTKGIMYEYNETNKRRNIRKNNVKLKEENENSQKI